MCLAFASHPYMRKNGEKPEDCGEEIVSCCGLPNKIIPFKSLLNLLSDAHFEELVKSFNASVTLW